MVDREMGIPGYSNLEVMTQLHLSKQDLNIAQDKVVDDDLLSRYSLEGQVKILSLAALTTEFVRLININQIKHELRSIGVNNIFLRGTGVTGCFPTDDFDISYYGPKRFYNPQDWPQRIMNIPVAWGCVPQEELDDCLTSSLRMSSSILEAVPLTLTDEPVADIVDRARKTIRGEGKNYYVLYRQIEEKRLGLPWKKKVQPPNEYKGRKEMPGGKRTIQRITWSLQSLYPNLEKTVNPSVLLMRAYYMEIVPFEIVSDAFRVLRMIKSELYEPEAFARSTQEIHKWYVNSLIPQINESIQGDIPDGYLNNARKAFDIQTPASDFPDITDFAEGHGEGYRKWLALWITSHNSSCPQANLYDLWERYLGRMAYRNMLRNLLRNPSFPLERVTREETIYDPHLVECYDNVVNGN